MSPALAAQLRQVDIAVVSGRIQAIAEKRGGSVSSSTRQGDREERLSLSLSSDQPSIEYHLATPEIELSISLYQGERLTVQRVPKAEDGSTALTFVQTPEAPVTLMLGPEGETVTWRAPSLWHLLLENPRGCREELVPLLELLRPDWRLVEMVDMIEQALCRIPSSGRTGQRARWSELVAQLASDSFADREEADRALRNAGPAVLSYLRSLDSERLDAEQQFRVRRLVAALTDTDAEDMPRRVSAWMATDPLVWISLLARDDVAIRRLAWKQLQSLTSEEIVFDVEADAETRRTQREALRARFDHSSPE